MHVFVTGGGGWIGAAVVAELLAAGHTVEGLARSDEAAHTLTDEGDEMRKFAEVIGARLGLPVRSVAPEQFGPLGTLFGIDQPSSSVRTQARFDWHPGHPRLLDDLRNGAYPS